MHTRYCLMSFVELAPVSQPCACLFVNCGFRTRFLAIECYGQSSFAVVFKSCFVPNQGSRGQYLAADVQVPTLA